LENLSDGTFITAHVGYRDDLLETILRLDIVPIQVVRDPRAILASFVPYILNDRKHFLHTAFQNMDNVTRYQSVLDGVMLDKLELRSLRKCCLALDPWTRSAKTLRIRFEDIVGARGGGSDSKRDCILEQLKETLDRPADKRESVRDGLYGPGRHTFRKGQIDSWRDEIPPAVLNRVSEELADILDDWGYAP